MGNGCTQLACCLIACLELKVAGGTAGRHLLTWLPSNASASPGLPDITRAKAQQATTASRGRLHFRRFTRVRWASGSLLAFRRLVRSQGQVLPPLFQAELQYSDERRLPCIPHWKKRRGGVGAFIHVSKAGGTAFRNMLLKGPSEGGTHTVRFQPNFGEGQESSARTLNFSVGRLQYGYEKWSALEDGQFMVPGGEKSWELSIPWLLRNGAQAMEALSDDSKEIMLPCLCTLHFDFSLVSPLMQALWPGTVVVLTVLRDPVRRFLSHFYFARKLDWTSSLRIRNLSPMEYLYHPSALLDTLMVWQDGMAAVAWLSGLSVHVGTGSTRREADEARLSALFKNRTETLQRAVKNYHKLVFVGLLEDMEGSMRLLRRVLGWMPEVQHMNVGEHHRTELSTKQLQQVRESLRVLAPMDLWLYAYISADFRARLAALEAGGPYCKATSRALTSVPEVRLPSEEELGGCIASREAISCGSEVFEGRT